MAGFGFDLMPGSQDERPTRLEGELAARIAAFLPPTPPKEWTRDSRHRFTWLLDAVPELGNLHWIRLPGTDDALPLVIPVRPPGERTTRRGRPTRLEESPERCVRTAAVKDLHGRTNTAIDDGWKVPRDESRSASGTTAAYLRNGRSALAEAGVPPWALWEPGQFPQRWWRHASLPRRLAGALLDATRYEILTRDRAARTLLLTASSHREYAPPPAPSSLTDGSGDAEPERGSISSHLEPIPQSDVDRAIAQYVQITDRLHGGAEWRTGLKRDAYRERALAAEPPER